MHPIINIAVRAARRGGNVLLRNLERVEDLRIGVKGPRDFVSEVDRRSEREIIDVIRRAYPDHGILAEESGAQAGDDHVWINRFPEAFMFQLTAEEYDEVLRLFGYRGKIVQSLCRECRSKHSKLQRKKRKKK